MEYNKGHFWFFILIWFSGTECKSSGYFDSSDAYSSLQQRAFSRLSNISQLITQSNLALFNDVLQGSSATEVVNYLIEFSDNNFDNLQKVEASLSFTTRIVNENDKQSLDCCQNSLECCSDEFWQKYFSIIDNAMTFTKNLGTGSKRLELAKKILESASGAFRITENLIFQRCSDLLAHEVMRTVLVYEFAPNIEKTLTYSSFESRISLLTDGDARTYLKDVPKLSLPFFIKIAYLRSRKSKFISPLSAALYLTEKNELAAVNKFEFSGSLKEIAAIKMRMKPTDECSQRFLGCVNRFKGALTFSTKNRKIESRGYLKVVVDNPKLYIRALELSLSPLSVKFALNRTEKFNDPEKAFEVSYDTASVFTSTRGDNDASFKLEVKVDAEQVPEHLTLRVYYLACFHYDDRRQDWRSDTCSARNRMSGMSWASCSCVNVEIDPSLVNPGCVKQSPDRSLLVGYRISPVYSSVKDESGNITLITQESIYVLVGYFVLFLLSWVLVIQKKRKVEELFINPGDSYPNSFYRYYVTIETGNRWFSGSDATIALKLIGERRSSHVHILQDRRADQVLKASRLVSYVITTSESLGFIKKVRMWRSSEDKNQKWLFKKLSVIDLETREGWFTFFPDSFGPTTEDITLHMGRVKELFDCKRIWVSTFVAVFRDRCVFSLLFATRLQGKNISRLMRLCILFLAFLMLLVNGVLVDEWTRKHASYGKANFVVSLRRNSRVLYFVVLGAVNGFLTSFMCSLLIEILRKCCTTCSDESDRDTGIGDALLEMPYNLNTEYGYQQRLCQIVLDTLHESQRAARSLHVVMSTVGQTIQKQRHRACPGRCCLRVVPCCMQSGERNVRDQPNPDHQRQAARDRFNARLNPFSSWMAHKRGVGELSSEDDVMYIENPQLGRRSSADGGLSRADEQDKIDRALRRFNTYTSNSSATDNASGGSRSSGGRHGRGGDARRTNSDGAITQHMSIENVGDNDYLAMLRLYSQLQRHQMQARRLRLCDSYDMIQTHESVSQHFYPFPYRFRVYIFFIILISVAFLSAVFLLASQDRSYNQRRYDTAIAFSSSFCFFMFGVEPLKIVIFTLFTIWKRPIINLTNCFPVVPDNVKPEWHWNVNAELKRQVQKRLMQHTYFPPVVSHSEDEGLHASYSRSGKSSEEQQEP